MILKLVMLAAALAAVALAIKDKALIPRLIVANMLVGIGLIAFGNASIVFTGMVFYIIALFIALLYGAAGPRFDIKDKILFVVLILPTLLAHIFMSMHWPFAGILTLVSIISLFAFVYMIATNRSKYASELGFMIVIVADVVIMSGITITSVLTL